MLSQFSAMRADAQGRELGARGDCPALRGVPPQRHTEPICGLLLAFLCALCVGENFTLHPLFTEFYLLPVNLP